MNDREIVREASELGLPPGTWPCEVTVEGWPYQLVRVVSEDGDVLWARYANDGGTLVVLND